MNKIYKLVWSRLSASLVAVSEISRGSSGGLDDRILNNFFCLALLCLTLFLSPKNAVASCTTSVVFDMLEITGNCDTGYELPSGQSFSTIYLQSGASVEGGILLNGNIQTLGANYYGVGFFPGGLSIQGGVINNGIVNVNSGPGVGTDEVSQSIDFIQNNNSITANQGIFNVGTIGSIDNTGTMIGDPGLAGGSSYGVYNASGANITSISNLAGGVIRSINGDGIYNEGTISSINNGGTISGTSVGVRNFGGVISALTNTGTISGDTYGIQNSAGGRITTLTNLGTITSTSGDYGIRNGTEGRVVTINNLQGAGNSSGPLTMLINPYNYNIIINSPTQYGQLSSVNASGMKTTFGIYPGSILAKGTYRSVLSGVSSSDLNNTTGNFNGFTWALNNSSGSIWDLIINGASTVDTQLSLVNTASALQSIYTLQNSVLTNSFSYDCTLFDKNNICISAGGRNTQVSAANGLNNTSALLIAAYRPHPMYRVGAYIDQNLSVNNSGSTVSLGNNTPLLGLFAAWNERLDGAGIEVKFSAAYGQKNATVTRQVVGTSEAGSGSSQLNSQGAQITAKYGFVVLPEAIISPYAGVRYTQNNMGGYTEAASSSVTAPLTFSALNTNATTALVGLGASYRFIPQAMLFASAGVETDTNTANGTYSATGISGLTPINFDANPVKTRPTATLGTYYDILKNQRLGITGIYRQEPYQGVATTTVMATFTVGL